MSLAKFLRGVAQLIELLSSKPAPRPAPPVREPGIVCGGPDTVRPRSGAAPHVDFAGHFAKFPGCRMADIFMCGHKFHRPKTKTREECNAEKWEHWPPFLSDHVKTMRDLMNIEGLGENGFKIETQHLRPCPPDCPLLLKDVVPGKKFTKREVLAELRARPLVCLWNLDVLTASS